MVTKQEIIDGLRRLGVVPGMTLEVHSSLRSFGKVDGGAETVIEALKELVTEEGSIFMPALSLSKEMELTEEDKKLGITVKIKILPRDTERTAMGLIADTFRAMPDTFTSGEVIATTGWGKHGIEAVKGGLDFPIHNGGKALLLGVDIYKLTAMHYVEGATPEDINQMYAPSEEINAKYPPDEWMMEAGHPPVKAWYKIQEQAFDKGLITETFIGDCRAWFFDIKEVISLYEDALKKDPYGLWGIEKTTPGALRLRPYKSCDAKAIATWCKDEETFYNWSAGRFGAYPITPEVIDSKYRNDNGDCTEEDNFYPMVAFDESGLVGHLIMRYTGGDNRILRFGWVIADPEKRGRGYGKKMIQLALKYAFEILGVTKVTIGVFEDNPAAYRCYLSAGFAETGESEVAVIHNRERKIVELEMTR